MPLRAFPAPRPGRGSPPAAWAVAYVGDFDAFRWGYARDVEFEVIEYGDPDNLVMGANIAGFQKIADAMMAQGIAY